MRKRSTFTPRQIAAFVRQQEATRWPKWQRAKSIDDLGLLVVDWLRVVDPATPMHFGLPDPETKQIADDLVTINSMGGVVTINSQPAEQGIVQQKHAFLIGIASAERMERIRTASAEAGLELAEVAVNSSVIEAEKSVVRSYSGLLPSLKLAPSHISPPNLYLLEFLYLPRKPIPDIESFSSFVVSDPRSGKSPVLWDALKST